MKEISLFLPIIMLIYAVVVFFLILAIMVIAINKKRNVLLWIIMALLGPIIMVVFIPIINVFSPFFILGIINLIYLAVLLVLVLKQQDTKPKVIVKCIQCQTIIQSGMKYCPRCGSIVESV